MYEVKERIYIYIGLRLSQAQNAGLISLNLAHVLKAFTNFAGPTTKYTLIKE